MQEADASGQIRLSFAINTLATLTILLWHRIIRKAECVLKTLERKHALGGPRALRSSRAWAEIQLADVSAKVFATVRGWHVEAD